MKSRLDKEKKWREKYTHVFSEFDLIEYKNIKTDFLILTHKELKELTKLTYRRIKYYNKNIKPKGWAGYNDNDGKLIK